jgi:antitoxin VapB
VNYGDSALITDCPYSSPNYGDSALITDCPYSSPILNAAINASCGILTLLHSPLAAFGSDKVRTPLPPRRISRIYIVMNNPIHTKTFKSGNSVAVRLPKGFAISADVEVELEKSGDTVTIRKLRDPVADKKALLDMLDDLKKLPKPPTIQKRDPFEFPDRPGL